MLKIKDSVDLNILINKYDFKPLYDKNTGKIIQLYRIIEKEFIGTKIFFRHNRKKTFYYKYWYIDRESCHANSNDFVVKRGISRGKNHYILDLNDKDYEILFDLIQAEFVEKC